MHWAQLMASLKKWGKALPTSLMTPSTVASTRRNRTAWEWTKSHTLKATAFRPSPSGATQRPSTVLQDCRKADTRNYLEPQNFENARIDQKFYQHCSGNRSHFTWEKGIGGTRQHPLPGRLKPRKMKGATPSDHRLRATLGDLQQSSGTVEWLIRETI